MAELAIHSLQKYQTMVKLHPDDPDAHFGLGLAYEEQGNLADAIRSLEQVTRLAPAYARAYLHRGFLFARNTELGGALD